MRNRVLLYIFLSPFLLAACSRKVKMEKSQAEGIPLYIAWYEDAYIHYEISVLGRNRFVYTIAKKNNEGRWKKERYCGRLIPYTVKYNTQRLHLLFDHGKRPPYLADDLLVEGSGNYLIQTFTRSTGRLFLQIEQLTYRR